MKTHPIEHITERLNFIQNILESNYDSDDGSILNSRIQDVSIFMAEAGKLKSDAEFHYRDKLRSEILKAIKELLPEYCSATLQNAFIKSCANDEATLVTFADRVNRSCVHQLDAMRTQLSYLKELSRNLN